MAATPSTSTAPRLARGLHHSNPSLPHLNASSSLTPTSTHTVIEDRLAPLPPSANFNRSSRRVSSNNYSPLAPPRQRKAFSIQALPPNPFGFKHPSGTASSINLGQFNNSAVDLSSTAPSEPLLAGPSNLKRTPARMAPPPSSYSPPQHNYNSRMMRQKLPSMSSSSSSSASASDDEVPQTPNVNFLPPGAALPAPQWPKAVATGKPGGLGITVPVAGVDLASGRSSPAFDEYEDAREYPDPEISSSYSASAYATPRTFTPQPPSQVNQLHQQPATSSAPTAAAMVPTSSNGQQMVPSLSSSSSTDDAGSLAGESMRTVSSNGSIPTTPTRLEFINSNFESLSNPATLDELRNLRQVAKELEVEAQRLRRQRGAKPPSPKVLPRKAVPVVSAAELQQQQATKPPTTRKAARMSLMNPVTVPTFSLQVDPLVSDEEDSPLFAPPASRKAFYGLERSAMSVLEFSSRKSTPSPEDQVPTYKPMQTLQTAAPLHLDDGHAAYEALGLGLPPAVPEKDKAVAFVPPSATANTTSGFRKFSRFLNKKKSMSISAAAEEVEASA